MLPFNTSTTFLVLSMLLLQVVTAFQPVVLRQTRLVSSMQTTKTSLHLHISSSFFDDAFLLSDAYSDPKTTAIAAASAAAGVPDASSIFNMNLGETVKNVALGITALVFAAVALTSLAAAILIPAGANQLEIECTALIPDTWEKYQNKLAEDEEMKDRPDLMFELGLLLNKCKADRLETVCVHAKLGPELWDKYQNMLEDEQELKDRPELIVTLGTEISQRAGQVLKENTNICPESTWEKYEEKAGILSLVEQPNLLEELSQELGYADLVEACITCLLNDTDNLPTKNDGDARDDATTISGITEIRRNTDQWGEDDQ